MLAKMQKSIDDLTKKYTEVLDENVRLKGDKADLLAQMREMEIKMDMLNAKVDELTEQLKNKNNERNQINSSGRRTPVRGGRTAKQGGSLPRNNASRGAAKLPRASGATRGRSVAPGSLPDAGSLADAAGVVIPVGPDGNPYGDADGSGALDEDTQLPGC